MPGINTVFKLIADNKTQRAFGEVDKSLDSAQKGISNLSGKIAGLVGAAGMGLLIKNQLDAAKSTVAWSKALDMNVETLSAWQYAAKEVNIDGEKMADVMKDVSEKIGDAFANNAGEAKEVMERLNLSMADMVAMSPDQQILAIANSLDQVGTQAEKIQIMEALGSDLSKMLPLLDDNAAGLHELMREGEAAGAIMNQAQAEGMQAMNDTLRKIEASNTALSKSMTLAFGDSFAGTVSWLSDTAIPAFALLAERIGIIDMNVASLDETGARVRIAMLTEELVDLNEEIAATNANASERWGSGGVFDNLEDNKARVAELNKELEALQARLIAVTAPRSAPADVALPKIGAFDPAEGGAGDAKAAELAAKDQERLAQQFERLKVSMMSEQDALRFHLEEKQLILDEAFFAGEVTHLERNELREQLEADHQAKLTAIATDGSRERAEFEAMTLKGQTTMVVGELASMTAGVAQSNKTMFKINKVAGIANAIVSAHEGASKSLAKYPMPLAGAMAAMHYAVGMARVSAIKSTSFGGGGGGGGGGGIPPSAAGTGIDSVVGTVPLNDQAKASTTATKYYNITLQGAFQSTESVRELIEQIAKEAPDMNLNLTIA